MTQIVYQLAIRILFWFALEVILSSLNLDQIADYGEFLYGHSSYLKDHKTAMVSR